MKSLNDSRQLKNPQMIAIAEFFHPTAETGVQAAVLKPIIAHVPPKPAFVTKSEPKSESFISSIIPQIQSNISKAASYSVATVSGHGSTSPIDSQATPNMFVRSTARTQRGHPDYDCLHDAPYLVALPFRVAEYTFDKSTDCAAAVIRTSLAPAFLTYQVMRYAKNVVLSKRVKPVK